MDVQGGGISQVAALKGIQPSDPDKNWETFSNWADSVKSFPQVTKQTVRDNKTSTLKVMLDLFYMHFSVSSYQMIIPFISLVLAATATVRAGKGGSVRWGEEDLPSQGHRAIPG